MIFTIFFKIFLFEDYLNQNSFSFQFRISSLVFKHHYVFILRLVLFFAFKMNQIQRIFLHFKQEAFDPDKDFSNYIHFQTDQKFSQIIVCDRFSLHFHWIHFSIFRLNVPFIHLIQLDSKKTCHHFLYHLHCLYNQLKCLLLEHYLPYFSYKVLLVCAIIFSSQ